MSESKDVLQVVGSDRVRPTRRFVENHNTEKYGLDFTRSMPASEFERLAAMESTLRFWDLLDDAGTLPDGIKAELKQCEAMIYSTWSAELDDPHSLAKSLPHLRERLETLLRQAKPSSVD